MRKSTNILTQEKWLMPENQIEPLINSYKAFVEQGKDKSITNEDLEEGRDSHIPLTLINEGGEVVHEKTAANVEILNSSGSSNGKIAVIDLHGTFFTRYDWFVYCYGGIGMDLVVQYLDMLEQDSSIDGVVFNIDSNGGSLAGTEALGKRISKFKKPIGAFVENACHSAAYWIASQCDFILTQSQTTYLGSIGVMMRHINREEMYKDMGMDVSYIAAPQSTHKITAPDNKAISEEDMSSLQAMLRQDCTVFINAVKKGRGDVIDIDAVSNGEIFNSANASRLGLHDGLATNGISDAIKRISKLKNDAGKTAESNINNKETMKFENLNFQSAKLSLAQVGNKKRVIVETAKLIELDEKFKGVDLGSLEGKSVDGIQLDFSAIGISATKATLSNVLGLDSKTYCLVNCEELAAINAMVEESAEEEVAETETEEVVVETETEEVVETETEEVAETETETETETEEVVVETEAEAEAEATSVESQVSEMLAKMTEMATGMESMSSQITELQGDNKTLSTELGEAKEAKAAAEEKAAKIVEKAAVVQKKFRTKIVLETDPSEVAAQGEKGKYVLGTTPKQKTTNAIAIARSIANDRNINKNGKIYKKGNEMQIGK